MVTGFSQIVSVAPHVAGSHRSLAFALPAGAAVYLGVSFCVQLCQEIAGLTKIPLIVDCGHAPAFAFSALKRGIKHVRFSHTHGALSAFAAAQAAFLLPPRLPHVPIFDAGSSSFNAQDLVQWLCSLP